MGLVLAAASAPPPPPSPTDRTAPTRTAASTSSAPSGAQAVEFVSIKVDKFSEKVDKLLKANFIELAKDLFNQLNNLDLHLSQSVQNNPKIAQKKLKIAQKKLEKAQKKLNLGQGLLERAQRQSAPDDLMKAAQDAFIRAVVIGLSARNLNSILKRPKLMTKISALRDLLEQGVSLPKELEPLAVGRHTLCKKLKMTFKRMCQCYNIPATPAERALKFFNLLISRFPCQSLVQEIAMKESLVQKIVNFLPADAGIEILSKLPSSPHSLEITRDSLEFIRTCISKRSELGPALALWIDKSHIDVRTLDLSPKEFMRIKHSLHHVVITKPFTSELEPQNFIAKFPEMTSLHINCYDQDASLIMIRSIISRKPELGYRTLASWINGRKLSLAALGLNNLGLNNKELKRIKPYLSYVDLSGMHFSTKDDVQNFIAGFPKMTHLTLHSITIGDTDTRVPLDSLPVNPEQIKQLKYLDCSSTSITTLPDMPALEFLNCNHCRDLTTLHHMPALRHFSCSYCTGLKTLPDNIPALTMLKCDYCTGLETLPDNMPALEFLNCGYCTNLKALPRRMLVLRELFCNDCKSLTTLPDNRPALSHLIWSNCPALTLPDDMPALESCMPSLPMHNSGRAL